MLSKAVKMLVPTAATMQFNAKDQEKEKQIFDENAKSPALNNENQLWYKLKLMYSTDEYGNISPELNSVQQAGFLGLFTGFLYGGFTHSKTAYSRFIERNQATAFETHLEAKKKLQDNVTLGFAKGAWKWGWRLCFFTTCYTAITTTIASCRGKSSIIEYIAAGGLTGALYKTNMGVKGMAAGGIFGSAIGGLAGALSLLILKTTGTTMEDIRYWQYSYQESKRKLHNQIVADSLPDEFVARDERKVKSIKNLDELDIGLDKLETPKV